METTTRLGGPDRPSEETWPEAAAVCVVVAGALCWFLLRLSPGTAFGPWQGLVMSDAAIERGPLLFHIVGRALMQLPWGEGAQVVNAASACIGAFGCGALAYIGASALRGAVSPFERMVSGATCGLLFAFTPLVVYAGTAATPTSLTLFLALTGLALMVGRAKNRAEAYRLGGAAFFIGLATANHPSFGLLLGVIVLDFALGGPASQGSVRPLLGIVAAFAGAAAVPIAAAMAFGETVHDFLAHALVSPYPAFGEAPPELGFGVRIIEQLALPVAMASVLGIFAFFRPATRRHGVVLAFLFLVMGPFLPTLTNRHGYGLSLVDHDAALAMPLAAACFGVAAGAALTVHTAIGQSRNRVLRTIVLALVGLLIIGAQLPRTPTRRHPMAQRLAERILAGCPSDAVLISGDRRLTSLVLAGQTATGFRRDVTMFPANALTSPALRARLRRLLEDASPDIALAESFPTASSWAEWQEERPQTLERFLQERSPRKDLATGLLDLALWDFTKHSFVKRPICFVGLHTPWLVARAQSSGCVLVYPRCKDPAHTETAAWFGRIPAEAAVRRDPGTSETLALLLAPLSVNARKKGRCEEALSLAELSVALAPKDAAAQLALVRAATRCGDKDEALDHAAGFLRAHGGTGRQTLLADAVKEELKLAALEQEFEKLLERPEHRPSSQEARLRCAIPLWQAGEIAFLARSYQRILDRAPRDTEALYELTAAWTQLGDLAKAREMLRKWTRATPLSATDAARILEQDGRLALLRTYSPKAPEEHATAIRFL